MKHPARPTEEGDGALPLPREHKSQEHLGHGEDSGRIAWQGGLVLLWWLNMVMALPRSHASFTPDIWRSHPLCKETFTSQANFSCGFVSGVITYRRQHHTHSLLSAETSDYAFCSEWLGIDFRLIHIT